MTSLLGCLGFIVLCIFFIAFALFRNVLNIILSLLGIKPPMQQHDFFRSQNNANANSNGNSTQSSGSQQRQQQSERTHNHSAQTHTGRQNEKIFHRNADEYVDFEEVNER